MPRRVVILNDASVARGGATGLALLSTRLLRARGIAVTYVSGDAGGNAELARIGVETVTLGDRPLMDTGRLTALRRGIWNRAALEMVRRLIAERDGAGVVWHLHGWSKILSPAVIAALRPVASRTLIHAHDYFLACPNGAYMDYRRDRPCALTPLGAACLATHCDKRSYAQKLWRVARQRRVAGALQGADWAGIVMIHPDMAGPLARGGVDPARLRTLRNPALPFTPDRVAAEDNAAVLFIGRIEAEKGIEDAIAAARRAGVPLVVVGDGPLRAPLAARHPEIRFTGWLDRAAIAAEVSRARALVMPSRYPEPFGLVAAEASQSGLPVLLPPSALLAREIAASGIGLVCDTRDVAAFAEALRALRDMPRDDLAAMSRRAHRHARAGDPPLALTETAWADGLVAAYDAALGSEIAVGA